MFLPRCDVTNEQVALKDMGTLTYQVVTHENGTWARRTKTLRLGKKVMARIISILEEETTARHGTRS